MKKLIAIIYIQMLASCATFQTVNTDDIHQRNTLDTPGEFKPLYMKFKREAAKRKVTLDRFRVNNLRISFGDFTHGGEDLKKKHGSLVIGLCTAFDVNPDGAYSFDLEVDRYFWENYGIWYQESLLFHELGHCVLKQGHRPNSLMNEIATSDLDLLLHEKAYLDELFSHKGE